MADATLELDLAVTLEDQLRFTEWLHDRPERRRKRVLIYAGTAILSPLLGAALGQAASSLQTGEPFVAGLGSLLEDRGLQGIILSVCCLSALSFSALRILRRPLLRRRLRKLLAERPGVDPADPSLAEPARFIIGPSGFTSKTAASTVRVGWAGIKGLADARTVYGLMTGSLSGYIIPKRCLSADQVERLQSLVPPFTSAAQPKIELAHP